MSTGRIEVICGNDGCGKTALALGKALQALPRQKNVIVIQFLKGNQKQGNFELIKRLEPEMKLFRFEKSDCYFKDLTAEAQQEERINILNGLNYAKKVMTTGECDLLILDEALGLIDQNIIREDELKTLLECRDEVDVILTGKVLSDAIMKIADQVERVEIQVDNCNR